MQSKRARRGLKDVERELRNLQCALDESAIVSVTDAEGTITYANENLLRVTKFQRRDLVGKTHRTLNSGYHPEAFFRNLWETILAGNVWHGEVRDRAKDGSYIWLESTIVPFLREDGKPYQFICIRKDVTKRKLSEMAVERDRARLRVLEGLPPLLEAGAEMAHEMRNPLAYIEMQAQITKMSVEMGKVAPEEMMSAMDRICANTAKINEILREFLNLSREARLIRQHCSELSPWEEENGVNLKK